MLENGQLFPEFDLAAHDGSRVSSASLRGSTYLVYFYPRADTPGCTKEACSFRDGWSDVTEAGLKVFGVSYDSPASNRRFAEKFRLPFLLLSDSDHALAKACGAAQFILPLPKRVSFLVGPEGRVLRAWEKVKPVGHSAEVLDALRAARR